VRTLAITGDDFGASHAVNRAIIAAYDRGVLTAASLMVSGDAADEAVVLARARPGLSIGLHLVLVDGSAASPSSAIPRLVGPDGRFRGGPIRAGLRYQFSTGARRELAREIHAQLERFADTGLTLSHVDGHHHLHLHPVVLGLVAEAARALALCIPAIRLPSEELGLAMRLDPGRTANKIASRTVFALLRRYGQKRLAGSGVGFSDRVYGLLATGRITEQYLLGLIPMIRAEHVEIYCHPADPLPGERDPEPPPHGREELNALTSPRVRAAIEDAGFAPSRRPPRFAVRTPASHA
jgi:hopanoid biosynthesis associated protein HpnK